MKKIFLLLILSVAVFLLHSCGGVVGNIEKYPFPNVSPDSLKAALNKVYTKYPELVKTDSNLYGNNNGDDFYYLLIDGQSKDIFQCNVITYPAPYDKEIDLSLTTATTLGNTMKLATKMSFWEKRKFRKLFEANILPKIKDELKSQSKK